MLKPLKMLVIVCLGLVASLAWAAEPVWNVDNRFEGWYPCANVKCIYADGALKLTDIKPDSQVINERASINIADYDAVEIKYRATGIPATTSGQLHFGYDGGPIANNWVLPSLVGDGKEHTIQLTEANLTKPFTAANRRITLLRLDMMDQEGGKIDVVSIRFFKDPKIPEWSAGNKFNGWQPSYHVNCRFNGEVLELTDILDDSQIVNTTVSIDTEKYNAVEIKYRATGTAPTTSGQFYFGCDGGEISSYVWLLPTLIGDGKVHTIKVTEGNMPKPLTTTDRFITSLRLDMMDQPGGKIDIVSIRFYYNEEENTMAKPSPEANIFKGAASSARWIWWPGKYRCGNCYGRREIVIDGEVKNAWFTAVDWGSWYLNGEKIPFTEFPQTRRGWMPVRFNFGKLLKQGKNILSHETKCDSPTEFQAGFICHGQIELESGKNIPLVTDRRFKVSKTAGEGWKDLDYDDSKWPQAMERGDVTMLPYSNVGNVPENFMFPEEKAAYDQVLARVGTLPVGLDKEPDCSAKVVYRGNSPAFEINGKLFPPNWVLLTDLYNVYARDMIMKTYRAGIRIYEINLATDAFVLGDGKYNFSILDSKVRGLLYMAPEAYINVWVNFDIMSEWCDKNPDELIGYCTGPAYHGNNLDADRMIAPSMASRVYREEVSNQLKAMCEYIKSQPWGKRVLGFRFAHAGGNEFLYVGRNHGPDTGKAMTAAFRQFLKERYKTDAALQEAWHNPEATIAGATVPSMDERIAHEGGFFRNPNSTDRKTWDYYECHQKEVAGLFLAMGKAVKTNLPGRLCGGWIFYPIIGQYSPEVYNGLLEDNIDSPYFDFCTGPCEYGAKYRRPGGTYHISQLIELFRKHKKLFVMEDDSRFHDNHKYMGTFDRNIATDTPEETTEVVRRNLGNALVGGVGMQFVNIGSQPQLDISTSWAIPETVAVMRDALKLQKQLLDAGGLGESDAGKVAMILNPEEMIHHGYPSFGLNPLNPSLTQNTIVAFFGSGHTFDLITKNQFLDGKKEYKTALFLNPFTFTEAERTALKAKLRRPGITAIWIYAPGWVSDKGFSDQAMSDLTGIGLKTEMKDHVMNMVMADGRVVNNNNVSVKPRVVCTEPGLKALASYQDDQTPAVVVKNLPDGAKSIFSGAPITDAVALAKILGETGSHAFTAPGTGAEVMGIHVNEGGNLLLIHVGKAGEYPVSLRRKAVTVTDLWTGETLARNTDKVVLKCDGTKTWLLELKEN